MNLTAPRLPPQGGLELYAAATVDEEGNHRADQKYHEQNLGDPGSACRDAAKAEQGGDQGNHEKNDSVMEHGEIPFKLYFS